MSLITLLGFSVAVWQLHLNRNGRAKFEAKSLIQWRAEMYEETFANITLSWEGIHKRVNELTFRFEGKAQEIGQVLNDYELRLIEVRFRLRGSEELHDLVSIWRDLAIEITHSCSLIKMRLEDNGGEWDEQDKKTLDLIKNKLSAFDSSFYEIESALKRELTFPKPKNN
jgi:hypothetical protein